MIQNVSCGQKACYFCGTTQIDVQKRPLCRANTHAPLITAGFPSAILSPADLRLPHKSIQQRPLLLSSHHRKALSESAVSLFTHSCSAVLLFLTSVYSNDENFVKWIFYVFSQSPTFSMLFRNGIDGAHRAERTALALRAAGGAASRPNSTSRWQKSDDSAAGSSSFQGVLHLTGSFSFLTVAQPVGQRMQCVSHTMAGLPKISLSGEVGGLAADARELGWLLHGIRHLPP